MSRVLFNMCGFYPFLPSDFFPLFYHWCVWCDTLPSNHSIAIPFFPTVVFLHLSPPVTLLSSSVNPLSSPLIALLRGCVWLGVFPPVLSSSSPSFLGEGAYALGARGGNSPARRGDWGETLLISRSADNLPVCAQGSQNTTALPLVDFLFCSSVFCILGEVEPSFFAMVNASGNG